MVAGMTLKTRRRLLWLADGLLCAVMAWAVAIGFWPLPSHTPRPIPAMHGLQSGQREEIEPLEAYLPSAKVQLRRPLADAPKRVPAPTAPARPTLKLVGLAAEKGGGIAMFRTPGGDVKCLSVGEQYAGVRVVSIEESGATVEFGGRTTFLKKEAAP